MRFRFIRLLLVSLIASAQFAAAQIQTICRDVELTAVTSKEFSINAAAYANANFSYKTSGTPASVSLVIRSSNDGAQLFAKTTAATSTSGLDLGAVSGPYRHWYADLGTLTGGTSPKITVTGCFTQSRLGNGLTGPAGPQGETGPAITTLSFASLGAVVPGRVYYCDDCDPSTVSGVANECTSAGTMTGAMAFGTYLKWACLSVN